MATAPAYGFKLQTLEMISETKSSSDRSRSLLHYLADVIGGGQTVDAGTTPPGHGVGRTGASGAPPPTLPKSFRSEEEDKARLPFDLETLHESLERAIPVSLETCLTDVFELDKGMELAKQELSRRGQGSQKDPGTGRLQSFVQSRGPEIGSLKEELKRAQAEYRECAEYFGENTKLLESSSTLFNSFLKFLKNYRLCLQDNRAQLRKKMQLQLQLQQQQREQQLRIQQQEQQQQQESKALSQDPVQSVGMNEKVRDKIILKKDEVYNGALEDILLGLKSEPYRRADGVRRSQRRKQEHVRLSHTEMDL